ncbi:MAG: hypothetical protein ACFFC7_01705 [Candidatus Hermodarchaeota archaeon]
MSARIVKIPKSAKIIYSVLQEKGKMKSREIHELLPSYTDRTVRNALRRLIELNLIETECDLRDMRSRYYYCAGA